MVIVNFTEPTAVIVVLVVVAPATVPVEVAVVAPDKISHSYVSPLTAPTAVKLTAVSSQNEKPPVLEVIDKFRTSSTTILVGRVAKPLSQFVSPISYEPFKLESM